MLGKQFCGLEGRIEAHGETETARHLGDSFDFRRELGKITPLIADGAKIYVFGAGGHWDYICKQYRFLASIDIDAHIAGFIDNDKGKQGATFHGKRVRAPADGIPSGAVVLIAAAGAKANYEIGLQLTEAGLHWRHSFFCDDWVMALLMRWEYTRLLQFRGKHSGGRCFVIGNGPSLSARDLDRLKGEVAFASNRIYLMFDKTEWRPSYYAVEDQGVLRESHHLINRAVGCSIFFSYNNVHDMADSALNGNYFYFLDGRADWRPPPYDRPSFSDEIFVLQWGGTVTYSLLQLAAYMGFAEIYLLGMDHDLSYCIMHGGFVRVDSHNGHNEKKTHFSASYGNSPIYIFMRDFVESAYQTVRDYCETHGVKIRNATRGGELEVFERVDFDSLFEK